MVGRQFQRSRREFESS
ncbi:hypothetical protein Goklo_015985 [Gossypium klotzschianum]|uniref:Uncharacterized protein n=1 Tax=Gossypium klotzschianum TaxID=34286 RepID=A0A7J8UCL4_9ROSI|nr:hypothetical protein [Gossypium klotzschianum]